jgi:predicted DsbA family dithiol-disulfide isomerase
VSLDIDIWSDVVCPFCYIGKRHLELALEDFPHADQVNIKWHSFELDPDTHAKPDTKLVDLIAAKYGATHEQAEAQHRQMEAQAAAVGLEFNWRDAVPGNTFDAHRLIQLAATQGLADAAEERLKRAYFTEGINVEDRTELRRLALEIGLQAADVDRVLSSDEFADAVRADERQAAELGVRGVPFFVIDSKYGVSGAQPVQAFKQVLEQVWEKEHQAPALIDPLAAVAAGSSDDAAPSCGVNGCD